jgi:hypothetical protein
VPTDDRVLDIERLVRGSRTTSIYENEMNGDGAQQEDAATLVTEKEISS